MNRHQRRRSVAKDRPMYRAAVSLSAAEVRAEIAKDGEFRKAWNTLSQELPTLRKQIAVPHERWILYVAPSTPWASDFAKAMGRALGDGDAFLGTCDDKVIGAILQASREDGLYVELDVEAALRTCTETAKTIGAYKALLFYGSTIRVQTILPQASDGGVS